MKTVRDIDDGKLVHDIKSPITAIKTEISLLIKYSKTLPRDKVLAYLKKIDFNIDSLNNNLNYFFELESLRKGRYKFLYEFIDIDGFLKEVLTKKHLKLNKKIHIKGDVKKSILSDRKLLSDALCMLVKNASGREINIQALFSKGSLTLILENQLLRGDVIEYFLPILIVEKLGGSMIFGNNIEVKLPLKPQKPTP